MTDTWKCGTKIKRKSVQCDEDILKSQSATFETNSKVDLVGRYLIKYYLKIYLKKWKMKYIILNI